MCVLVDSRLGIFARALFSCMAPQSSLFSLVCFTIIHDGKVHFTKLQVSALIA